MKFCYVNGNWVPHDKASISIDDRGYQFGDGAYEVIAFFNRNFLDVDPHLARLSASLKALSIKNPFSNDEWLKILRDVIVRNDIDNGGIYLQVTRGVSERNHLFPPPDIPPAVVVTVFAQKTPGLELVKNGVSSILYPDLRWKCRHIKSLNLLPNLLAKQAAADKGAYEAILVDDGQDGQIITEASVANLFAIINDVVVTHPANKSILGGITRQAVLAIAKNYQLPVEETVFSVQQLQNAAQEVFVTSTTANILPVTTIDGNPVADGAVGKITKKLIDGYVEHIEQQTGYKLWS